MKLICARLGENLDTAETWKVVFGSKRILVDANLPDGFLRRQAPSGESVDESLPSVGGHGRASQRLKICEEFVRIVGHRLQISSGHNDGAGIRLGRYADRLKAIRLHRHLLAEIAQLQLHIEDPGTAPRNLKGFAAKGCKPGPVHLNRIASGSEAIHSKLSCRVSCDRACETGWTFHLHRCSRNDGLRGIHNAAFDGPLGPLGAKHACHDCHGHQSQTKKVSRWRKHAIRRSYAEPIRCHAAVPLLRRTYP